MATLNDLVLVHIDNKPGFYARIDGITPDVKPGWWQVKLLVISFPLQVFTWILDASQIAGAPFTMAGTPVMLEKVVSPVPRQDDPGNPIPAKKAPADREKREGTKVGREVEEGERVDAWVDAQCGGAEEGEVTGYRTLTGRFC